MLNFDFLEKDLGIVSPLLFVYDFLRKMFLMLYSINSCYTVLADQTSFPDYLYFLRYWSICVLQLLLTRF